MNLPTILALFTAWTIVVIVAWSVYCIWNKWLDAREQKGRNPWDRE